MSKVVKFLLLFLFFNYNGFAQSADITGIVVVSSEEPLSYATVVLYPQNDSIPFANGLTGDNGEFILEDIPFGAYQLSISFLGFTTKKIQDVRHVRATNMETIVMEPSNVLLEGVTVVGEQSLFQNKIDRKVYQVGKDVMSETGSAADVLQNVPSVTVDIDGGISLRGTSNITVFVNGKPSAIFRRNVAAALEQLPAASIERIEIITNPSAKFRPDGIGGIINIVLKKKKKSGFNGLLSANIGTEKRFNTNTGLNYGRDDFNLFANYGFRTSAASRLHTDDRLFKNVENENTISSYEEIGVGQKDKQSHNVFAGLTYDLNDVNSLEISANYYLEDSDFNGLSEINTVDGEGLATAVYSNKELKTELERETELSLVFEHAFKNKEDHGLEFEVAYADYYEKEKLDFNQVFSLPVGETQLDKVGIEKGGHQTELSLGYTLPLTEEIELEAGYEGEFIYENIKYDNNSSTSQFVFNRGIHGVYTTYSQGIEDFSFLVGLRGEQTYLTTEVLAPSPSKTPNNGFKLFPSIHLSYELGEDKEMGLSYSKRLNRPDPDELNPNPEFDGPRNAEAGNPNIKPEQIHSLELAYQVKGKRLTFSPTAFYRYKYDAFTSIQSTIGDSIILETSDNLATQQLIGLEFIISTNSSNKWKANLSGNAYHNRIDASNLGLSANKSVVSGSLKGFFFYKITKSTGIQFNAFYYFPRISPLGKRKAFFYLNGGFKQSLFKDRAALIFTVADIFHSYKTTSIIESAALNQTITRQRKRPVLYLGFNWRFNNYSKKVKEEYEKEGFGK